MSTESLENRELALPPGVYAYTQNTTKGQVRTYTGPIVINQTGQERPVTYDSESRSFFGCLLEKAAEKSIRAYEGDYIVLENPAHNGTHPREASVEDTPELYIGQKVNIPGPCTFSLWPLQAARVIPGHRLRSNQYLVVRIYNEEKAKENWSKAIQDIEGQEPDIPESFAVGSLHIIKGTDVSFYIPPIGVEVVADTEGEYSRDAVTLERLEYCILIDEDGNKRYEKGPQVVFPEPTEQFIESRGMVKFLAVELNEIQGLHIKVIQSYDEEGKGYIEGDELFITGKETAIYFPRPEHSLISYDGKSKHYATAIPAGEGRYVMNRMTGEIKKIIGPAMLLPDPRYEVIVRRVLADSQVSLWYPGNQEALEYNRQMRGLLAAVPSTRQGAISEGDFERGAKKGRFSSRAAKASLMEESRVSAEQTLETGGDEFTRASSYTQPRTVTLDTKYQGVPPINIWTGYAVMVVNKRGGRRVVLGPDTVLLDYDEELEALHLSSGKPKNTDNLQHTTYLRVANNQVSDIITEIYTKDHVKLTIKTVYQVDFEGDFYNWFSVENYVKLLCDHVRSMVKGYIRKLTVREFYGNGSDILRDIILGKVEETSPRPGLLFKENGMRVKDVEVMFIRIEDENVRNLLDKAQHDVVASNIEIEQEERSLEFRRRKDEIIRELLISQDETKVLEFDLNLRAISRMSELAQAELLVLIEKHRKQKDVIEADEANTNKIAEEALVREKAKMNLELEISQFQLKQRCEELEAATKAVVERFSVAQGGFSEALLTLSHEETLTKVAQAASIQTMIGGNNLVEVLESIFSKTGLQESLKRIVGNNL